MPKNSFNQTMLDFYRSRLLDAKAKQFLASAWLQSVEEGIAHFTEAVRQESRPKDNRVILFRVKLDGVGQWASKPDPILDRPNRDNGEAA